MPSLGVVSLPSGKGSGSAARPAPKLLDAPGTIHFSRFIWSAVVIALLAFGIAFIVGGIQRTSPEQSVGLIPLGSLVGGLGLVVGFFLLLMLRGRRAGREMLTTLAIVAGIPMLIRGIPGLSVVAVCMLLAAAALWAPASRAYFKKWDPKPPRKRR
ncbi:hypothetical protein [Haematomicrobium sanguinis]|uniref:hypothetical protein n=1 Tax=Haematomicrobium sanguinis TaxID=479106 RepID=UPI000479245D|nr:hypothetical protein [Haematomicrobium sanguinis]